MKTILTLCIGLLIPHFIFSQSEVSNSFLNTQVIGHNYLPVSNKEPNKNILKLYKAISKSKALYLNQSNAVLPVKQSLDSIISVPADTTLSNRKNSYTYNTNGKLTSSAEYIWNKSTQSWDNVAKGEWQYDAKRNNITYITYYGDQQDWYNELKYEYTYDGNNKLIREDGYGWNDGTTQWELGSKIEYTYNAQDLLAQEIFYEWDSNNSIWNQTTKKEYSYNTSNQLDSLTSYEWQSQWNYKDLRTFEYYVFDRERLSYYYLWDGSGQWTNFSYTEIQYDIDRKLNFFYEYRWDVISVIYVNYQRIEYKYDINNNVNQTIFAKWVKSRQDYVLDSREDMIYDLQHTHDELLLPPDLKFSLLTNHYNDNEIYFNHKMDMYSLSLHNGVNYIPESSKNFYYSPINITGTKENYGKDFVIMPNPADDYFRVIADNDSGSIEFNLTNLNGKQLISKKINSNEDISIQNFNSGIYFYRITDSKKTIQTGKLVIQ